MDPGLDTGPMLLKRATEIDENEDIISLHDRMSVMGAQLLGETVDGLKAGQVAPLEQDSSQSCYAPMLKKEDGLINWYRDARAIHNQVRGMTAWPVAYTCLNGQPLKIYRTKIGTGNGLPGSVLKAERGILEVACLTGSIFIDELQLAGKKRLDSASFLAGCPISPGTLFTCNDNGEK
jgi:methionyl-tRNA formyltransferase